MREKGKWVIGKNHFGGLIPWGKYCIREAIGR
jgi:hypothetical protein